jgi:hypothetical protein
MGAEVVFVSTALVAVDCSHAPSASDVVALRLVARSTTPGDDRPAAGDAPETRGRTDIDQLMHTLILPVLQASTTDEMSNHLSDGLLRFARELPRWMEAIHTTIPARAHDPDHAWVRSGLQDMAADAARLGGLSSWFAAGMLQFVSTLEALSLRDIGGRVRRAGPEMFSAMVTWAWHSVVFGLALARPPGAPTRVDLFQACHEAGLAWAERLAKSDVLVDVPEERDRLRRWATGRRFAAQLAIAGRSFDESHLRAIEDVRRSFRVAPRE